jgi:putative heme-binding domain-containing protein
MFLPSLLVMAALAQLPDVTFDDYSQWRLAQGPSGITGAEIQARPGFEMEVVRTAEAGEGSWISLAFDPKGRLVVGREDKGLLRLSFDADHKVTGMESIEQTLLEPRGLLFAHDSLYVTANNSKGVYRLRDTDGDDQFDEVKLLKTLEGGVGHGRNGMALGPDGKIYVALGNNVKVPADIAPLSPYRHYGVDRLLPCVWNEFLFDSDVTPPAGWIARTDKEGEKWEIFAGGFRNPYDLAFNEEGELFTYDADMEWDVGAPWYRPTTVMHVVSGGEYGWRQGTNVWPDHFPDCLPRVCDIGLGSPTGVAFGTKSNFPPEYRKALFICDWAYGRIIAVHLEAKGSSYVGRPEVFLRGKPLNVTDLIFGPDGAMYFSVGGRGTRAAVYRVVSGINAGEPEPKRKKKKRADLADSLPSPLLKSVVQSLLPLHTTDVLDERALEKVWSTAAASPKQADAFTRHAATVVVQHASSSQLKEMLRRIHQHREGYGALPAIARRWNTIDGADILQLAGHIQRTRGAERRSVLRALELALLREERLLPIDREALIALVEKGYPGDSWEEAQLALELLAYLDSPNVAKQSSSMFPALDDRQRLFVLYALRNVKAGWTLDLRRQYIAWLKKAESFEGAQYMPRFVTFIRSDFLAGLSDAEREALKEEIAQLGKAAELPATAMTPRPVVRQWKLPELVDAVAKLERTPDLERGKAMFHAAQCSRCHRVGKEGHPFGPDLTHVSGRFGRRELLEAIVEPSKVVDEKYRIWQVQTHDGQALTGQLVGGDKATLFLARDPLRTAEFVKLDRDNIAARKPDPTSPMPTALLDTLTPEEVQDLLAYLGAR